MGFADFQTAVEFAADFSRDAEDERCVGAIASGGLRGGSKGEFGFAFQGLAVSVLLDHYDVGWGGLQFEFGGVEEGEDADGD